MEGKVIEDRSGEFYSFLDPIPKKDVYQSEIYICAFCGKEMRTKFDSSRNENDDFRVFCDCEEGQDSYRSKLLIKGDRQKLIVNWINEKYCN